MGDARQILVVRAGALGDFVLTLPVLECLRARFPDAHITLAGYPDIAMLAKNAGLVDELDRIDRVLYTPLFAEKPDPPAELRAFACKQDLAVVIWHDAKRRIARGLEAAGAPCVLHIEPIPDEGAHTHSIPHMLSQLPDGWGDAWAGPLQYRAPAVEAFEDLPVIVHPGSGGRGADRNWPPERFAEVANRLAECIVLEGPADDESVRAMLAHCDGPKPRVLRGLTIPEVAAALRRARAFVGNDSGVTHLAAAVGIRTVAIFGVTDEDIWRPDGADVRLLKRVPIDAISVDDVMAALG